MIDRRSLIKTALTAMPASMIPGALNASVASPSKITEPDAWIVETAYDIEPTMLANNVHVVNGDVTPIWYSTLDPAWRQPGFVVSGITSANTLFILERLAWDRGRRVTSRQTQSDGAILWTIEPVHPSVTC